MDVEYNTNMTKKELLNIATANGIAINDDMTKAEIIDMLKSYNNEQADSPEESMAEDYPAESVSEITKGYDRFIYAGPTLPNGQLKGNVVFSGTWDDVLLYLSAVLEKYPQVKHLIVPVNKIAAFSVKVKTPGNIAHKHYNDIVSAMHHHKEV